MGRAPCCDKANVKKGPWSPEEDLKLKDYIEKYGTGGNWIALPLKAGLKRCGKSCRLRWLNYLRPNIKHGEFSDEEDRAICTLFANIGSRWSIIASQLPGRTDNDIKNYWNTKLKKKLMGSMQLLPSPPSMTSSTFHQGLSILSSPSPSSSSSNFSLFPVPPNSFYNSYPDHLISTGATNTATSRSIVPWETGNNNTYLSGNVNNMQIQSQNQNQNQFMMFQGSDYNYNNHVLENYHQATDVSCCNSSDGCLKEVRQEGILGISHHQSCELEDNQTFILHNYNNNHAIQQGYFGDNSTASNNYIINNNNNSCFFSTIHDQYYSY